jgi:hypothetical protein
VIRPSLPHHLRNPARIIAVRFVDLRLRHRLHVPRFRLDGLSDENIADSIAGNRTARFGAATSTPI